MTTIKELAYIGVEASDLGAWHHFAVELLGMQPVRQEDGLLTLRLDDRAHRIIIVHGPADDLAFAGYDCGDDADLETLVARLRENGVEVTEGDAALAAERRVRRIAVARDPEGNRVELVVGLEAAGTPFRSGPGDDPQTPEGRFGRSSLRSGRPNRSGVNRSGFQTAQGGAGHMFLSCAGSRESMLDFYALLGFRLSDYIKEEIAPGMVVDGAFTHCNGRHHTLAFAEMPLPKKMHHFLVEVNDMSDVGWAYDRVVADRTPLEMTLGMHPNDRMFSFYAVTPSGFAVEYGWGGLIIEDDESWEVKEYDRLSAWGHKHPRLLGTELTELAGLAGDGR